MIQQIVKVSLEVPPRSKFSILAKATEELGEVATILNKPSKVHDEPIEAEVCDVINAVVDLAFICWLEKNPEGTPKEFEDYMKGLQSKKLLKWKTNYLKHVGV